MRIIKWSMHCGGSLRWKNGFFLIRLTRHNLLDLLNFWIWSWWCMSGESPTVHPHFSIKDLIAFSRWGFGSDLVRCRAWNLLLLFIVCLLRSLFGHRILYLQDWFLYLFPLLYQSLSDQSNFWFLTHSQLTYCEDIAHAVLIYVLPIILHF